MLAELVEAAARRDGSESVPAQGPALAKGSGTAPGYPKNPGRLMGCFLKKAMSYKLDLGAFALKSFEEASRNTEYWRNQSPAERLRAAIWLSFWAFGFDPENPPRMDKTKFSMRKNG